MTKFMRIASLIFALLVAAAVNPAHAILVLSADVNIVDGLPGGAGTTTAGNATFFQNILGGNNSVLLHGPGFGRTTVLNSYFNSLSGVSSSIGAISAANLSGADLLVSLLPSSAYSASELADMNAFLSGGGDIMFVGENSNFASENTRINTALAALGSTMSIIPGTLFDAGYQTAVGSQIGSHPLTAGVASLLYAAPSEIIVAGGTTLFSGTGRQPFVAVEGVFASVPDTGSTLTLLSLCLGFLAFARRLRS